MSLFQKSQPIIETRALHLDLKGTPPTAQRLLGLLDVFAAARYNAVLVEWEDMFPWTVDKQFRSETAYTQQQVKDFHAKADSLGIQIIPLIQCLGHMETPLSLPEYAHMREVPHRADVLNPLADGARELIEKMVDDVLALTPNAKYLHLGGDEAWTFGTHPDTKAYIEKHSKGKLYLQHIEPILDKLNAGNIRPILWHDMMRDWDDDQLQCLGKKADLCVWGYNGDPDTTDHHFNSKYTQRFRKQGINCWAGAAYKGADGVSVDLPITAVREHNTLAWTKVAQRFGFVGAFATAWSRYNTGRSQCEPIDGSLDSLVNVGIILHDGQPPKAGLAGCVDLLEQIGEKANFENCRNALAEFADCRCHAWKLIQEAREALAIVIAEPNRVSALNPFFDILKMLKNSIQQTHSAAAVVEKSLTGLMQQMWVKSYLFDERIAPLQQEQTSLEHAAKQIAPELYEIELSSK